MKLYVFLEFHCFLYDPPNVGNLISGSFVFSKPSLNIWKFLVHVMLKPHLEDFEHYLTSLGDKYNCLVVWTFFSTALGIGTKIDLFQTCGHRWAFQICWHTECSTLIASSFRIWNSSAGIPLPSLALLTAVLPKVHLTSHSRMSGSGWVSTPWWLSESLSFFVQFFHVFFPSFLDLLCFY